MTISSKILLQKTTNNKTIESYRYDADGNLTGAEADIITWEERNTEIYSWLNDAAPPFDRRPPITLPARTRTVTPPEDQALVRMASVVHRAPPLAWSGSTVSIFCHQCLLHLKVSTAIAFHHIMCSIYDDQIVNVQTIYFSAYFVRDITCSVKSVLKLN